MRCTRAADDFHARYDASGKIYRYRLWKQPMLSPFEADRSWHIYGPLDLDAVRWCCEQLIGTHNFVRLSANRGDMPETERRLRFEKTTRTIHRAEMRETGDFIELEFSGDGFLYKMDRLLTGGAYLNYHSTTFAGGELRGQVRATEEIPSSRMINVSTRGFVGLGAQQLIQGLSVIGPDPVRILISAKGPSLTAFGVTGALADPMIDLYDSAGRLIAQNDNVGKPTRNDLRFDQRTDGTKRVSSCCPDELRNRLAWKSQARCRGGAQHC